MNIARTALGSPELGYCVEGRPWLWTRPVTWAIGDRQRFQGKRVLEHGCRYGKMSCYFASSLGALVNGVDVQDRYLEQARSVATQAVDLPKYVPLVDKIQSQ
jgi:2-polyprenyl-3-methyl-5-hydroxy-6-metoxy-1,4-benzoquinol methylase